MSTELLSYMKRVRGPPHKGHKHHEPDEVENELQKDGMRMHVNYRDLVERLQKKFPTEYNTANIADSMTCHK